MPTAVESTVATTHKASQARPGWWDEAQQQTAVILSLGKLQGEGGSKSALQGSICKVPLISMLSLSGFPFRNSYFGCSKEKMGSGC